MRFPAAASCRPVPVLLAVLLASAALVGAGASIGAGQAAETPGTTIQAMIQPDGDARVAVTMRFALEDAKDTEAFDRLASEFENGTADVLTIETFERAAAGSAAVNDRPMEIRSVSRTGDRADGVGRLELGFTWGRFARTEGDRILLGDVFRTPDGTWLPRLDDRQTLVISFPDRYRPVSLDRPLRNGSIVIEGPVEFDPGEPRAMFEQAAVTTPTATATPTATPTATVTSTRSLTPPTPTATPTNATGPTGQGVDPILWMLLALLGLAGVGYLAHRSGWLPAVGPRPTADSGDDGDGPAAGAVAAGTVASGEDEEAEEDTGEPLLSDEERVLSLLEAHDGRMKQRDIVEETDWSNAKVSQLLSELDEAGSIEKLRIGRENLITLPDRVPDGVE